jgi:hypothetical protein
MTATTIPTITPGARVHHWLIVAVDGRRATCRCRCGEVRVIALDALADGHCTSCGCSTPTPEKMKALREDYKDQKRRKNFNWRIESRGR